MLNQAQVTTQPLSLISALPVAPVVRSATEVRGSVLLQSFLIKGTNEKYLTHPDFHQAFEDGYDYPSATGEFMDGEVTLDQVLDLLEQQFSMNDMLFENSVAARYDIEPLSYASRVGFAFGLIRYLFDADRAPYIPLSLLQKWYRIEYLTRSIAARFFVACELDRQHV